MSMKTVILTALAIGGCTSGPVAAQSSQPPSNPTVQAGPLALQPGFQLTDFGHDSNVFNRDSNQNPVGDMTATVSPQLEAWLRLPHARLTGRSRLDYYYFKELTDLRALDSDSGARLDVPLNRLTPYVDGIFTNTRHRQNLEIDAFAGHRTNDLRAGADVRLTPKVSAGAFAHRSDVNYQAGSFYLGIDLSRELNYTTNGEGAAVRWAVTPYTTFSFEMARDRDRFKFAADRNADSVQLGPSVEFKPLALVSGRASIAFRRRKFLSGGLPDFNGTVAFADLRYVFREGTLFTVALRRSLEYSYLVELRDYLSEELTGTVTQRFGGSWDAGGSFGRGRVLYPQDGPSSGQIPDETVLTETADVGCRIGQTRVGFHVEHRARQSDRAASIGRGYDRLRIGSTVTYLF